VSDAVRALRRVLVPLLVALGLLLMHGGIGQAVACTGMSGSSAATPMEIPTATPMGPTPAGHPVAAGTQSSQAVHHQVANDPLGGHHNQMCLSTPTKTSGGGPNAAPALLGAAVPQALVGPRRPATVTRATGREPPAPDLMSVLCVIRR
jgi:hypothetical protein